MEGQEEQGGRHGVDAAAPIRLTASSCEEDPATGSARLPTAEETPTGQRQAPTDPPSGESAEGLETAPELDTAWRALLEALRKDIRREQFETWFRRARLRAHDDEQVRIVVQNSFARDWLTSNYRAALEDAARVVFGGPRRIEIDVDPELSFPRPTPALPAAPAQDQVAGGQVAGGWSAVAAPSPQRAAKQGAPPASQLLWSSDFALNPSYTFDSFVVGPCNRFAHAAALGVSEAPGSAYNPFFLHGSVGLGKTHLLQSLCFALLERDPSTRILYLSCETFINHFISALENGDLQKFRNKYRNVDVLVVDDIHMLANKERTQEEFFNTFNTLYNAGKQIVLSSDSSPKEIPTLQDRLVSRFKWGLVTEIESPCYETRMAIVRRKSRERGRELPEPVAHLLAEHIDSNIRELEGAVTRVIGFASLAKQEISVELARRVLRDVFTVQKGQPTMEDVMRVVTAHFNVKLTDLQSRRRTNAIAHPRQIGMYLARKITRHSLEEIGGFFGGRDHTTVLHAVRKIEGETRRDDRFRALVASFLDQLQRG
jgi:chromosomal replication initiator protein